MYVVSFQLMLLLLLLLAVLESRGPVSCRNVHAPRTSPGHKQRPATLALGRSAAVWCTYCEPAAVRMLLAAVRREGRSLLLGPRDMPHCGGPFLRSVPKPR